MTTTPHHIRFARALALVTGLAGVAGCGGGTSGTDSGMVAMDTGSGDSGGGGTDTGTPGTDTGTPPSDTGTPGQDSAMAMDDTGVFDCSTCQCTGLGTVDSGLPSCEPDHTVPCCAAIGPLAPPDLPA